MNQSSNDNNRNFNLRYAYLRTDVINRWNKIIRDFEKIGVELVEFSPKNLNSFHWSMLPLFTSLKGKKKRSFENFAKHSNKRLREAFEAKNNLSADYWGTMLSEIALGGFFIPIQDVNHVDESKLTSHLKFFSLMIKYFPFDSYFSKLHQNLISLDEEEDKIPHAIWQFLIHYTQFLNLIRSDSFSMYNDFKNWYTDLLDINDFHKRLPSEQITILLLNRCESLVYGDDEMWHKRRLAAKSISNIQNFLKQYQKEIDNIFLNKERESSFKENERLHQKIKNEFASIFKKDKALFLVQEILDNKSEINLASTLPLVKQLKLGPNSLYNVSGVIKDMVFTSKARHAGRFREHDDDFPKYYRIRKFEYPKGVQYWFDLTKIERQELIYTVKQNGSSQLLEEGEKVAEKRSKLYLLNLINLISAPMVIWERNGSKIFPQWNLLDDLEAREYWNLFNDKRNKEREEKEILEKLLKTLYAFDNLEDVKIFIEENKPAFYTKELHDKWELELNKFRRRIIQKEKFYERKMMDFGMDEYNLVKKEKNIWVKELLKLEEEIKPYINYVKQAFQTALPIRKNVDFSKYRHSSDGVEFDADTLYDQEKWVRANVMKVMESNIEKGDAIQINTFCLDYSGSMRHERMRNLFKMLYLLVLGLEDRKSIDSFHFFSNNFIEVVNFSESFTTRKVLFKIMRHIARIEFGEIIYGGFGGTNISEGVGMSYDKMQQFTKKFREGNPQANIVTSMFVITDGEPSLGILTLPELAEFIESKRKEADLEIKGIFIKSEEDLDLNLDFMAEIFGEDHYVETSDFKEGVNKFVKIMTETYKQQRKAFKWKQKKRRLGLTK